MDGGLELRASGSSGRSLINGVQTPLGQTASARTVRPACEAARAAPVMLAEDTRFDAGVRGRLEVRLRPAGLPSVDWWT
jgi:hypothetical protein